MTPSEVKNLPASALPELAGNVRKRILETVASNGGHLASSLGAVELAIGLVRVFDPPNDPILWDVGHQAYAWKLLTGRDAEFSSMRKLGGVSGFLNPEESPCDAFVSGHAGTAIAAAEGIAVARDRLGAGGHVVAVVGDASLTNGESFEALNNCTALTDKLIIVVNDNAMSISKNVGAFARTLGRLLAGVRYNRVKAAAERAGHRLKLTFLRQAYHRLEQAVKSFWLSNALSESFGLRYVGPVDGHDLKAVESALTVAKEEKRSVLVHVVTVKGRGFAPAEHHPTRWHGIGPFNLDAARNTPHFSKMPSAGGWSEAFGTSLLREAAKDKRVCAITAAMKDGTGLVPFAEEYPARFFDVGICESHLVTFAAGLAKAGMRPVVAVYSTFLQRAVDQVMHDVCLLNLPVVFAIDRAGVVGADGRTHHGMFDIPMLRCLPNLEILQPRDAAELSAMLSYALSRGAPTVIRYPRGAPPPAATDAEPRIERGVAEQISGGDALVQIWALGDQVPKAMNVAEMLAADGIRAGVVNARFVKPFDAALLARHRAAGALVVSLENGSVAGGFGEAIGADVRCGWPDEYVSHGSAAELEAKYGFSAEAVCRQIRACRDRR